VVRVDDLIVGTGRPGPWAARLLAEHYARAMAEAARDAAAWDAA
jgi:hypothetical protein